VETFFSVISSVIKFTGRLCLTRLERGNRHILMSRTLYLNMEASGLNSTSIQKSSITELESVSQVSVAYKSLCQYLRNKNYIEISTKILRDLIELKQLNWRNTFCIRDTSEKNSREQQRPLDTFEVFD